jgi:hypothetical protein
MIACCSGHASDDSIQPQCPGAAAWREKHSEYSNEAIAKRDQARTISKPDLLQELHRRADADQDARKAFTSHPNDSSARAKVISVDASNLAWMPQLLKAQGFPNVQQVGETGMHLAWMLI